MDKQLAIIVASISIFACSTASVKQETHFLPPLLPTVTNTVAPTLAPIPTATIAPTSTPEPTIQALPFRMLRIRECESHNDYSIISDNGLYFGAYQFDQATWDYWAAYSGFFEYIGVRPNEVPPYIQDIVAFNLYLNKGGTPWPVCQFY